MTRSIFDRIAASLSALKRQVDSQPVFREADVTSVDPVWVRFDTDASPSPALTSLDGWLTIGDRVLTMTLHGFVWVLGQKDGFGNLPVGTILEYGGLTAPPGFLLLSDGVGSRTLHHRLFELYGTQFGAGDGSTTFGLPDHVGRTAVQMDPLVTEFNSLGKTSGARTHILTLAQMPLHNHGGTTGSSSITGTMYPGTANTANGPTRGSGAGIANIAFTGTNHNHSISSQGSNQAHNNIQPSIAMNFIVKY